MVIINTIIHHIYPLLIRTHANSIEGPELNTSLSPVHSIRPSSSGWEPGLKSGVKYIKERSWSPYPPVPWLRGGAPLQQNAPFEYETRNQFYFEKINGNFFNT